MNQFAFQFTIKEIPDSADSSDRLSSILTEDFGIDGFKLIAVTPIPHTNPPSMLLSFQKKTST